MRNQEFGRALRVARQFALLRTGFFVLLSLLSLSVQASRYVYDASGRVIGVVNGDDRAARYQYLCPRQPQFCIADSFS